MNISHDNGIAISTDDVKDFKITFCNENEIIKGLLKKDFLPLFEETIMDVGGGTADILSEIVPEKNVIQLDVLDFSDTSIPEMHTRIIGDFLDTNLLKGLPMITTLFMSHVHQFIDYDLKKLKNAITQINAKRIILVEDVNDDMLGEVMRFSLETFPNANPEVLIEGFPFGYRKIKSVPFTATLTCSTFIELTKQCLYLMDLEHSQENFDKMSQFLELKLMEPTFTINQEINVYEK
jgi:hypothetical protein